MEAGCRWLRDTAAIPRWAAAGSQKGTFYDRRVHAGALGGGRPFRPPDAPLEPEDEALHLSRAQRHLYHRPGAHRAAPARDLRGRQAARPGGARHPVRRHEEAGAGRRPRGGRARRDVLHQPALARRHAHELRDDSEAHRAFARAREYEAARRLRAASKERGRKASGRDEPPRAFSRRHQGYAPPARRDLRRGPEEGAHRRPRGEEAEDPHHRGDRYELRSGRDRLSDPRQRRCDSRGQADGRQDRRCYHRGSHGERELLRSVALRGVAAGIRRGRSTHDDGGGGALISYQPRPEEIKALREETSAPMMDCRKALLDAGGDAERAKALLLERGAAQAAKKAERTAEEGLVTSYIHAGGKIGVLVELNSETDFVARNPKFGELARDVAMHVAAMSPRYIDREGVPTEEVERLRAEFRAAVPPGKSPEVADRIVEGKLAKWYEEHCLLDQAFVKDDSMSVGDLVNRAIGSLGERICVRRFVRYALVHDLTPARPRFSRVLLKISGEAFAGDGTHVDVTTTRNMA